MEMLYSHSQGQVTYANTQIKACQRVSLTHPQKEKLKIFLPYSNF